MIPDIFVAVGLRLELLVFGWITIILFALAALALLAGWWRDWDDSFLAVLLALFGALTGIVWVALLVPFQGQYHRVYEVDTTVLSVTNVLTEASGELTREPVAVLDGIDRPVVIDDPRILELKGRDLTLLCTVSWHYQAADSYSCKIRAIPGGAS